MSQVKNTEIIDMRKKNSSLFKYFRVPWFVCIFKYHCISPPIILPPYFVFRCNLIAISSRWNLKYSSFNSEIRYQWHWDLLHVTWEGKKLMMIIEFITNYPKHLFKVSLLLDQTNQLKAFFQTLAVSNYFYITITCFFSGACLYTVAKGSTSSGGSCKNLNI